MFNNVAQFKKFLAVGVKLKATHHQAFAGRDEEGKVIYKDQDLGIRPVSIVQTNSFALKTTRENGEVVDSWCDYPAASQAKVENGKIVMYEPDLRQMKGHVSTNSEEYQNLPLIPILTYEIVQ